MNMYRQSQGRIISNVKRHPILNRTWPTWSNWSTGFWLKEPELKFEADKTGHGRLKKHTKKTSLPGWNLVGCPGGGWFTFVWVEPGRLGAWRGLPVPFERTHRVARCVNEKGDLSFFDRQATCFVFTANTTMSCLETSKSFMRFCKVGAELLDLVTRCNCSGCRGDQPSGRVALSQFVGGPSLSHQASLFAGRLPKIGTWGTTKLWRSCPPMALSLPCGWSSSQWRNGPKTRHVNSWRLDGSVDLQVFNPLINTLVCPMFGGLSGFGWCHTQLQEGYAIIRPMLFETLNRHCNHCTNHRTSPTRLQGWVAFSWVLGAWCSCYQAGSVRCSCSSCLVDWSNQPMTWNFSFTKKKPWNQRRKTTSDLKQVPTCWFCASAAFWWMRDSPGSLPEGYVVGVENSSVEKVSKTHTFGTVEFRIPRVSWHLKFCLRSQVHPLWLAERWEGQVHWSRVCNWRQAGSSAVPLFFEVQIHSSSNTWQWSWHGWVKGLNASNLPYVLPYCSWVILSWFQLRLQE